MIAPDKFFLLEGISSTELLRFIAFYYGHKLANEIAGAVIDPAKHPPVPVQWPVY